MLRFIKSKVNSIYIDIKDFKENFKKFNFFKVWNKIIKIGFFENFKVFNFVLIYINFNYYIVNRLV